MYFLIYEDIENGKGGCLLASKHKLREKLH